MMARKSDDGAQDIALDRQVNMFHVIVPVEGDTTEEFSLPVHGHFIVLF